MAYGLVYVAENRANDKPYVGQTTMDLRRRWIAHVSMAKTSGATPIYRAMRKHGAGAFTVHRIVDAPDAPTLDALERFWIGVFGSLAPAGYNLTSGGQTNTQQHVAVRQRKSASHRLRYSDPGERAAQAERNRLTWANASPEMRKRHRDGIKSARRREPPAKAVQAATERLLAARDLAMVKRRKPVLVRDVATGDEKRFESIREAADVLGLKAGSIQWAARPPSADPHVYRGYTFTLIPKGAALEN